MSIVFLLAIVAFLLVGIVLLAIKKAVILGKIFIILASSGALFVVGLVAAVIFAFSSARGNTYAIIILVTGLTLVSAIALALFKVIKKKAVYIPICIILFLCIASFFGLFVYERYDESIATVGESNNLLLDYAPYSVDTKVADLPGPSELRITENVPRLDGATALYPIYSAFAKAVYPKALIDDGVVKNDILQCNTTKGAYESIVMGDSDIAFLAAPSEEQKKFAEDNGVELIYTPIGKEAFVFFVNKKNTIEDITIEQIQKIYSGEITSWSDLGVERLGKIKAFQRDEGSGSQSALIRMMDGKKLIEAPRGNVIDGMGGIIAKTADYKNYKNAIGYSFRFYSSEMVKNDMIKLLSVNGVYPSEENIENGTYPITSSFYAVTRSDADENTKKFVEWICGANGQKLVALTGYTPIGN